MSYQHVHAQGGDWHCPQGVLHFIQTPAGFELLSQSSLCTSPFLSQLLTSLPAAQPPSPEDTGSQEHVPDTKGPTPPVHEQVPAPPLHTHPAMMQHITPLLSTLLPLFKP